MVWGIINKIVTLILPFISRTCIIYLLGANYVGLNSLFTSVLSMLSLAELGFGSAVVYSMYKPIAEGDNAKICALMRFYKIVYRIIGLVVLTVGVCIAPFLPLMVKSDLPPDVNLYFLYAIYLGNSVISYWLFAYKNCMLNATQRTDIISKISSGINIIVYSLQIGILFTFRNYYLYSICMLVSTVSINIVTSWQVDKLYPEFKSRGNLEKSEIKSIMKQVSGLMIQRLAYTSRNSLDSIVISSYLGLIVVGIYNNYFYVLNALTSILAILFTAMQGGLGNSVAKEKTEKNYSDYNRINCLYMIIAGWCSICLLVLFQPFMKIWVGETMMFPFSIIILFSVYFYVMKMTDTTGAYISATGLWWRCKWSYIIEAVLNLVLNVAFGYLWGVTGIIVATIITVLVVNYLLNTHILYKYYFVDYKFGKQIKENILYFMVTIIVSAITYMIASLLPDNISKSYPMLLLGIKGLICVVVPLTLYWAIYRKNKVFIETYAWICAKFTTKI